TDDTNDSRVSLWTGKVNGVPDSAHIVTRPTQHPRRSSPRKMEWMSESERTHTSSLAVLGALLFITARSLDSADAPGTPASADPAKLSPTDRETLAEVEAALTAQLGESSSTVTSPRRGGCGLRLRARPGGGAEPDRQQIRRAAQDRARQPWGDFRAGGDRLAADEPDSRPAVRVLERGADVRGPGDEQGGPGQGPAALR